MGYYLAAFVVFLLDQFTKWLVVKNLDLYESVSVIGEFFQITSHRNRGAAFGILQNQRVFFIIITVIVVLLILFYLNKLRREKRKWLSFALALLLGGALGNFWDRLFRGEVIDFLKFHFQFDFFGYEVDYVYPIFNLADSAIVVAVIMIIIDAFWSARKEEKEEAVS